MTANHKYFDFLCALAASDQLTGPELAELREHSLQCVSCRNRILEMNKVNAHLLLAHAFSRRNGGAAKGMRERFIARAIKDGVPLNAPLTGGFGTLGMASALFVILLVTAAAVKRGPFSRPAVDASRSDASRLSTAVHVTKGTSSASTVGLVERSTDVRRDATPSGVLMQAFDRPTNPRMRKPRRALPAHLKTIQDRDFPARWFSPRYALVTMTPGYAGLSSSRYTPPKPRFAAPPALISNSTLQLLADSEHSALDLITLRSGVIFSSPAVQGSRYVLDVDPSRVPLAFEFRGTPPKFQFVENLIQ
jgi:hypothetical protein